MGRIYNCPSFSAKRGGGQCVGHCNQCKPESTDYCSNCIFSVCGLRSVGTDRTTDPDDSPVITSSDLPIFVMPSRRLREGDTIVIEYLVGETKYVQIAKIRYDGHVPVASAVF